MQLCSKMPTAKNEVRLLALNEEGKENVEAVCQVYILFISYLNIFKF